MDRYRSFSELAKSAKEGKDFSVCIQNHSGTTVVIATHGGGIEPGTSEIAAAIAGYDLSFYAFEGIKPKGNRELHITSTHFDEPKCIALVTASPRAIAIHGEDSEREVVFLGGRDEAMVKSIRDALVSKGFSVETHKNLALQGRHEANICNRTASGRGVQMELSDGLRRSFFTEFSSSGGRRTTKTEGFNKFVAAVREVILRPSDTLSSQ